MKRAGKIFKWKAPGDYDNIHEDMVFVLLEDRIVWNTYDRDPGASCLIIDGEVYGCTPGDIVTLRGIIDSSEEVE